MNSDSWGSIGQAVLKDIDRHDQELQRHTDAISKAQSEIEVMRHMFSALAEAQAKFILKVDTFVTRWDKYSEDRAKERECQTKELLIYQASVTKRLDEIDEKSSTRKALIVAAYSLSPSLAVALYFLLNKALSD